MSYCLLMDSCLSCFLCCLFVFWLFNGSVLGFLVKDWSLCGLLKAEIGTIKTGSGPVHGGL